MVNFTREPIIESIVTPKEGCKLVIRNSKGVGHDEYFVDALEIVSFGTAIFYRSNEKPKPFLLPITDYEVLEVRDTRLVLKTAPLPKLSKNDRNTSKPDKPDKLDSNDESSLPGSVVEVRQEKKRRRSRRKKDREDKGAETEASSSKSQEGKSQESKNQDTKASSEKSSKANKSKVASEDQKTSKKKNPNQEVPENKEELKKMLVPPPILISDTISRYKDLEEDAQADNQDVTLSISKSSEDTKLFDSEKVLKVEQQEQALAIEESQTATPSAVISDDQTES